MRKDKKEVQAKEDIVPERKKKTPTEGSLQLQIINATSRNKPRIVECPEKWENLKPKKMTNDTDYQ